MFTRPGSRTGIGNVGLGVDGGGMTVNVGPNQLRIPTDEPQPLPPPGTSPR